MVDVDVGIGAEAVRAGARDEVDDAAAANLAIDLRQKTGAFGPDVSRRRAEKLGDRVFEPVLGERDLLVTVIAPEKEARQDARGLGLTDRGKPGRDRARETDPTFADRSESPAAS